MLLPKLALRSLPTATKLKPWISATRTLSKAHKADHGCPHSSNRVLRHLSHLSEWNSCSTSFTCINLNICHQGLLIIDLAFCRYQVPWLLTSLPDVATISRSRQLSWYSPCPSPTYIQAFSISSWPRSIDSKTTILSFPPPNGTRTLVSWIPREGI